MQTAMFCASFAPHPATFAQLLCVGHANAHSTLRNGCRRREPTISAVASRSNTTTKRAVHQALHMPTLYSSSSSSLHRPQSAALTRPARPQSAQPAYKYTSPEPNYTNYPSSPAHRAPPQLHLAVGNAASSLAGVVTKLRESVGRQTDGRIAAWSVDVKEHADNLRRLAEEAEYVDERIPSLVRLR